jgi:hypothetical protein
VKTFIIVVYFITSLFAGTSIAFAQRGSQPGYPLPACPCGVHLPGACIPRC